MHLPTSLVWSAVAVSLVLAPMVSEAQPRHHPSVPRRIAATPIAPASSACERLSISSPDDTESAELLRSAQAEALARRDATCGGLVASRLVARGECESASGLLGTLSQVSQATPLPQCVQGLASVCNIIRRATQRGRGDPTDCTDLGLLQATVQIATQCMALSHDSTAGEAARNALLQASWVCTDHGAATAGVAALDRAFGLSSPELAIVRQWRLPYLLTDAGVVRRSHDWFRNRVLGTETWLLRDRVRDLVERLPVFNAAPPNSAVTVGQALIVLDAALTTPTWEAWGVILPDVELLDRHGLLAHPQVSSAVATLPLLVPAGASLPDSDRVRLTRMRDRLTSLTGPEPSLAAFRLNTVLALNNPSATPCNVSEELVQSLGGLFRSGAMPSMPLSAYSTQVREAAQEGHNQSQQCSGGSVALRFFDRILDQLEQGQRPDFQIVNFNPS